MLSISPYLPAYNVEQEIKWVKTVSELNKNEK